MGLLATMTRFLYLTVYPDLRGKEDSTGFLGDRIYEGRVGVRMRLSTARAIRSQQAVESAVVRMLWGERGTVGRRRVTIGDCSHHSIRWRPGLPVGGASFDDAGKGSLRISAVEASALGFAPLAPVAPKQIPFG
jgi:hypothetical protein